jgi:hypothetical protein
MRGENKIEWDAMMKNEEKRREVKSASKRHK